MARRKKAHPELHPSGARIAADHLREIVLEQSEGSYLGSETGLAEMLGVGRATLRQTARILEHEGLLKVKRGIGGGYYGRRPDIDAVAEAAATYLRTRNSPRTDMFAAAAVLDVELARLAALSNDAVALEQLRAVEKALVKEVDMDRSRLTQLELEFRDCLFRLAGNAFIELMLRIHIKFNFQGARLTLMDVKDRITAHRSMRAQLARAILDHDPEYAMLISRRNTQLVRKWVAEELGEPDGGGEADLVVTSR